MSRFATKPARYSKTFLQLIYPVVHLIWYKNSTSCVMGVIFIAKSDFNIAFVTFNTHLSIGNQLQSKKAKKFYRTKNKL